MSATCERSDPLSMEKGVSRDAKVAACWKKKFLGNTLGGELVDEKSWVECRRYCGSKSPYMCVERNANRDYPF